MKSMKTAELFAGIGGFRLAAEALGIQTVWANDKDPKACAVYRNRFGSDSIIEGDVLERLDEIPPHDILSAGFPCQPFSSAGKKQGIEDARGTLFQVIIDVLRKRQPRYFILENVKRLLEMENGWHFATILHFLSQLDYRIEWRLLNATHFGLAQNRKRVIIVGVRVDDDDVPVRLTSETELSMLDPEDLSDLVSVGSWPELGRHGASFPNWGLCYDGRFFSADLPDFSDRCAPVILTDVLERHVDSKFDFTDITMQWLHKNTPVESFVDGVQILSNQAGGARMGYTIFGTAGVAPTLTASTSRHYERYKIGNRYRRLTNVEYARLQGFPDDHCKTASIYDQYILFGNAVPPPLASWALARLVGKGANIPTQGTQIKMALSA
jgi:DNA (cytosine-5)-methyltransferase 1